MRRRALGWCAVSPEASWAAAAGTLEEWLPALATAEVRGAGVSPAGRSIVIGNLQVQRRAGSLRPVVARETVVGAYFSGEGSLVYTLADGMADAVFRTNVKRATSGAVAANGAHTNAIRSALILVSPGGVAMLFPERPPPGEPFSLDEHRARFDQLRRPRYPTVLAQARTEPPMRPLSVAEIAGKGEDYLFTHDTVRDHQESLFVLKKVRGAQQPFSQWRYAEVLGSRPLGRPWLEPRPKPYQLTDVDHTLSNPRGRSAELTVRETLTALQPSRVLALSRWSDRVIQAGVGGHLELAPYTLQAVRSAAGAPLPYLHASGDLVVQRPEPLPAGATTTLEFVIRGDVFYNCEGMSYWELPTASWLPMPARLELQYFTYHAVVKAAAPFTPFSCGRTVRRWQEEGLECAEFREEKPIQIPVILAGKYRTLKRIPNGVTIRVSRYLIAEERSMQRIANIVTALLDVYKHYLGEYPVKELNVIEINAYGFGQALTGIIFITKEAFSPLEDVRARLFSQGINARLAHELAHTWWGHGAKLGEDKDQWLPESLAENMAEYAMGRLWKKQEFDMQLRRRQGNSKFVKDKGTVYLANYRSGGSGFEDRVGRLYNKGPLVLHALRQELGDDQFFIVLKTFVRSFEFRYAGTCHFLGITDFIPKKEMRPCFDRFLLGTEWPAQGKGGRER